MTWKHNNYDTFQTRWNKLSPLISSELGASTFHYTNVTFHLVDETLLYGTYGQSVYAYSREDFSLAWQYDFPFSENQVNFIAVTDNLLFLTFKDKLYSFDKSGNIVWSYAEPADTSPLDGILEGNFIYFVSWPNSDNDKSCIKKMDIETESVISTSVILPNVKGFFVNENYLIVPYYSSGYKVAKLDKNSLAVLGTTNISQYYDSIDEFRVIGCDGYGGSYYEVMDYFAPETNVLRIGPDGSYSWKSPEIGSYIKYKSYTSDDTYFYAAGNDEGVIFRFKIADGTKTQVNAYQGVAGLASNNDFLVYGPNYEGDYAIIDKNAFTGVIIETGNMGYYGSLGDIIITDDGMIYLSSTNGLVEYGEYGEIPSVKCEMVTYWAEKKIKL